MSARRERSRQMAAPGYNLQTAEGIFKIRSRTDLEKYYEVRKTGNRLICSCPDHFKRSADCKHIHTALEMIRLQDCRVDESVKILGRFKIPVCKHCDSGRIKKAASVIRVLTVRNGSLPTLALKR